MSWDDHDREYSADGICQECGADTAEAHHAFCAACWAMLQGWRRPDLGALEQQRQQRERVSVLALVERVDRAERQVVELIELVASIAARLERLETQARRAA